MDKRKSGQDKKGAVVLIVLGLIGYGVYAGGDTLIAKFEALPVKGGERTVKPATDVNELKELYPVIAQSERVKERLENAAVESAFRLPPPKPEPMLKEISEVDPNGDEEEAPPPPSLMERLPNILWIEAVTDNGVFLMGQFWEEGEQIEIPGLPFEPRLARVTEQGAVLAHEDETVVLKWKGD
mgnify:CR=1 FL=1